MAKGLGFSPYGPSGMKYDRSLDPNYQEKHADYDGSSDTGQDYPDGTYYRRREVFYEEFNRDAPEEWGRGGNTDDEAWRRQWRQRWKKRARDAGIAEEDADGMISELEANF
jgi:hypothetical protein